MLVEDDNNLREIYEARLLAEGYDIVSAQDGEEALALAVKEKPDLIIADIMMPKISGFDMLDILRSTPETKDTKVVMMTALSQAEDKDRATKLGADRYLVKSQVTLEDVARVAREVLDGKSPDSGSNQPAAAATPTADPVTPATAIPINVATPPSPPTPTGPASPPPASQDPPSAGGSSDVNSNNGVLADALSSVGAATNNASQPAGSATAVHTKVIAPINDLSQAGPNLQDLVAKEEAKEAAVQNQAAVAQPVVNDMNAKPAETSPANPSSPAGTGPDPNSIAL